MFFSSFRAPINTPRSEVKGIITDGLNKVRLARINITLRGPDHVYKIQTDNIGSYSMFVTPGIYSMELELPGCCNMRRGQFLVEEGKTVQIDSQIMIAPSDVAGKFNYSELDPPVNSEIRPLVVYGEASAEGHLIRYTGPVLPHTVVVEKGSPGPPVRIGRTAMQQVQYPVVFTYNLLTIRSTELAYDRDKHLVKAAGEVEVQDSAGTRKGTRAEVVLIGLTPQIEMTQEYQ